MPGSDYVEEVCNGEKWSPLSRDYVFPKGCGAKRRILKEAYPKEVSSRNRGPRPVGAPFPPDSAWKVLDSGKP